jgi:uncharacterized membrane-anchored protein
MTRAQGEDEMNERRDHPLRVTLSELMHLRALPLDRAPVRLRQWVFLVEPSDRDAEAAFVGLFAPGQDTALGRAVVEDDDGGWLWERHQEFSTWTWFAYGDLGDELGFQPEADARFFWLHGAPGQVFRGVEISVGAAGEPSPSEAALSRHIDLRRCVSCDVFDGAARIWTDFRLREGGAGRIHVHNQGLANDEVSRLVQTLLEIGNYRKLALLGFAPARETLAWLDGAEARLAAITSDLAAGQDSQGVLDHLLALSAEVEARAATSRFRRGATESYHQLTLDRLEALRERRLPGHSTMSEFIARRLLPAMRTREAADRRLDDLSQRVARCGDLLRAKLGLAQDRQNQETLRGMDASLQLQTKLQGLVEGLSIFAVGYYVLGLLGYLLKPWLHGWPGGEWVLAGLVPLVLIAVAASLHRRKKRLIEDERP